MLFVWFRPALLADNRSPVEVSAWEQVDYVKLDPQVLGLCGTFCGTL